MIWPVLKRSIKGAFILSVMKVTVVARIPNIWIPNILKYSNHLNTKLVWYSNSRFVSGCKMVCQVTWLYNLKSDTHTVRYLGVGYSDGYCSTHKKLQVKLPLKNFRICVTSLSPPHSTPSMSVHRIFLFKPENTYYLTLLRDHYVWWSHTYARRCFKGYALFCLCHSNSVTSPSVVLWYPKRIYMLTDVGSRYLSELSDTT